MAAGKKMPAGPVRKQPERKTGVMPVSKERKQPEKQTEAKPIVIKEDQKTKKLDQAPEEVLAMAIREMMRK